MTTSALKAAVSRAASPAAFRLSMPAAARSAPARPAAVEHAEKALWRMLSYYGNALDDLDAAIAEDPTWALAHLMKANVLLSMTEHGLGLMAADSLQRAAELAAAGHANERERRHIAATQACAAGQWQQAGDAWERILLDHPQDLVALQIAHLFDFFRGDARNLHRRVARVLPEWSPQAPLVQLRARHARLRARGVQPVPAGARRRPGGARARCTRPVGRARGDACARDAGPVRPGRALSRVAQRRLVARQRLRVSPLVAPGALPPRALRYRGGARAARRAGDAGRRVRAAAHRHQRLALAAAADGRRRRRALRGRRRPVAGRRPKRGTTRSTTCTPCCRWWAPAGSTTLAR